MAFEPPQGYRPAKMSDICAIVEIHTAAFPGFFMTMLGPRFLASYYRIVLSYPEHVFWVKEGGGVLEGFVSGFIHPAMFYRKLRSHRFRLASTMFWRVMTRPRLIPRLWASAAQARSSSPDGEGDVCELSSIAVLPDEGGKGIGRNLVQLFVDSVREKTSSVVLTTDADGNEDVNRFYVKLGFSCERTFEQSPGRKMNFYRLSLNKQ